MPSCYSLCCGCCEKLPPKPKTQQRPPRIKNKASEDEEKYITIESQIHLICIISYWEISVAIIILLAQTVAIAASYEFASRSLTGIWTSWFFFMSAAVTLFWSSRCTFNGLLAVLVLQIISATMSIPLFTACCVMFGVYPFVWSRAEDGTGGALVGSSIVILVTNLVMMIMSGAEMILNAVNAYNCYFLAYVGKPKVEEPLPGPLAAAAHNYQDQDAASIGSGSSSGSSSGNEDGSSSSVSDEQGQEQQQNGRPNGALPRQQQQLQLPQLALAEGKDRRVNNNYNEDPSMPKPPPDLTLTQTDILVIKYCGVAGVILGINIFCAQIAMFALAKEVGIGIGVGIWAAALYTITGIISVISGWSPSSQRTIGIFILQIITLVLSIPLAGIAYYTVAVFGSCMQENPVDKCPKYTSAGVSVTILGGLMAISGTAQGLISLVLVLICSQTVCGIRCMISGATVYPML